MNLFWWLCRYEVKEVLESAVLRIEISDSYKFASALKRPEAENSDPGALREERGTEPRGIALLTLFPGGY